MNLSRSYYELFNENNDIESGASFLKGDIIYRWNTRES
jgi:hypothetical protein